MEAGSARARHTRCTATITTATFTNITTGSGFDTLDVYGLGATVGDFDNDGRDDVFVTTTEGGRLLRNAGGNRFVDVTQRAGIRNSTFAVSAAWLDYDHDGLLDLFVGNYVEWSPAIETQVRCTQDGERGYCGPDAYKPVAPEAVSQPRRRPLRRRHARAGLGDPSDKAMGVAVLDYNGDGWPDLFVGSDRVPAKLYRNDGRGHFVDEAVRAGVALSENGVARANMGADAADYDRSGRPHIVVGNFVNEMLGLYHNENGTLFRDVAPRSDVGRASLLAVTWATFFFDADLDGFLDIFAANGGTDESQGRDARARLSQAPLLLRNRGNGTFENITASLGAAFNRPVMGRGAAYLDIDGDGDLDLAMTTLDGPAVLFRNDGASSNTWLRVRTTGTKSNRERHRRRGASDQRVGNAVADGAQRLELRVAERADAHVRTRRGHPRDAGRGDVAVGQNADTHRRRGRIRRLQIPGAVKRVMARRARSSRRGRPMLERRRQAEACIAA